MKKIIIYLLSFIIICFIIPALLTKKNISSGADINETDKESKHTEENINEYNYNKYGTIKLLHQDTGNVEEVKLDEYLCNVVSGEMPADFDIEALKAQAVVARTYTIYKVQNKKHENADICDNSSCCQAWISKEDRLNKWDEGKRQTNWEKIQKAVYETSGKIITYNNKPINAFFHSNSGGTTELPVNVWGGGTDLPYLHVVETSGEDGYTQYSSEVEFTNEELLEKLRGSYQDITIDFNNNEDIKILEYTNSRQSKNSKIWKL